MPRDLEQERQRLPALSPQEDGMSVIGARQSPLDIELNASASQNQQIDAIKHLHPYACLLGLSDLDSCLKLEEATFPEHQRATREKILYRLSTCGELCLGLFSPAEPQDEVRKAATAETANATDSREPERKGVLLAHIIATKTRNETISDEDMKVPEGGSPDVGHQEDGRTIGIHSLAVLPEYQGKGLGTILMKSYIQRMVEAEAADRIAILTYENLTSWYTKTFGFQKKGKSAAAFGGGDWEDMILEFSDGKVRSLNLDEDSDSMDDEE